MRRFLATSLLLFPLLVASPGLSAATYHDYGASPFVKMMLLMMDLFGLLDRVPNGAWGYPYTGWGAPVASPWLLQPGLAGFPPVQTLPPGEGWGLGPNALDPWAPIPEVAGERAEGVGLNGIWQGQAGDLMAIYGNRFLWSDSRHRTLSGLFRVQGDYLVARVAGHPLPLVFRIQQVPDGFIAIDGQGRSIRFRRLY